MPRMTICKVNGREVDVSEALADREHADLRRTARFDCRCLECGEPVRPHKAGSHGSAHFEHARRNPACSLSDVRRTP